MANKKFLGLVLAALATTVLAAPLEGLNSNVTQSVGFEQTIVRASDSGDQPGMEFDMADMDNASLEDTEVNATPSLEYAEFDHTADERHDRHFEEYDGRRHFEHVDDGDDEGDDREHPSRHPHHEPSHSDKKWKSFEDWQEHQDHHGPHEYEHDTHDGSKFDSSEDWHAPKRHEHDGDESDHEQPHYGSKHPSHHERSHEYDHAPHDSRSSRPHELSYEEWEHKYGRSAYDEWQEEVGRSRSHRSTGSHDEYDGEFHGGEVEKDRTGVSDERGEHWEHWEHSARHEDDEDSEHHQGSPSHTSSRPHPSRTSPRPHATTSSCEPDDGYTLATLAMQKRDINSHFLSKHQLGVN